MSNQLHTWVRIIDGKEHKIQGRILRIDNLRCELHFARWQYFAVIILGVGAKYYINNLVIKRFTNTNFNILPEHWMEYTGRIEPKKAS